MARTHSTYSKRNLKFLSKLDLSFSFWAYIGSNNSHPYSTDKAALANSPYSNTLNAVPSSQFQQVNCNLTSPVLFLFFIKNRCPEFNSAQKLLSKTLSTIFTGIPGVIHGIISPFHGNIQPFSNDNHVLFMTEGHDAHLPNTAYFLSRYYLHFLPQHSPRSASY